MTHLAWAADHWGWAARGVGLSVALLFVVARGLYRRERRRRQKSPRDPFGHSGAD